MNMFLYGASGHARVILDILAACGTEVAGLIDDNPLIGELLGVPVFRSDRVQGPMIISIGNNEIRKRITEEYDVEYSRAIHPSALISPSATVGDGSVVMQGAIIQQGVGIGRHCIVNTGASVDHECRIGDYVHLSPHVTLCGNVTVGEGTHIGAGAVVIPGVTIGCWSVIGAGTVVLCDIPDGVTAVGNKCRIIKRNKISKKTYE